MLFPVRCRSFHPSSFEHDICTTEPIDFSVSLVCAELMSFVQRDQAAHSAEIAHERFIFALLIC
jgi:hypothetical protein